MQKLTNEQMKRLIGGNTDATIENGDNSCNLYCTHDKSICKDVCLHCVDGGNAGGKLCAKNP